MEPENKFTEEAENYKTFEIQLNEAIRKAESTEDLREAKSILIETQQNFRGVKLFWKDREELNIRLQEAFRRINNQIENEKKQSYEEALLNYTHLKVKVEEASFLASNPKDFNETWEFLLEVQAMFKNTRLLNEHRETLYGKLQEAFAKIKEFRERERSEFASGSSQNQAQLNELLAETIKSVQESDDFRGLKEKLINIQSEIRNAKLTRDVRDELNTRLQDAFTMLHIRQDAVFTEKRQNAENQFQLFENRAKEILKQAQESTDFNKVRADVKQIQSEIRESALFGEQRDSLRNIIQEAFETVNNRQDQERLSFETDAQNNYNRLKKLVDDGLTQANESNEYKETREYLKKIQAEFKGIKLVKEQREALYNRLQSAFDILNTRVDIYFREKKKNWEVKMQYKLSSLNTEVYRLRETIANETQNLKELDDFYQNIANPAVHDTKAVLGLKARISSLQVGIEKKKQQVAELENEIADLQSRIETDKTDDNSLNQSDE
jgi:hypothetical protein